MHKSRGNAIWFGEAADEIGADFVRWLSAIQRLTQQLRFGFGRVDEVRGWLRTLWNVYSFFATYANVDGWPRNGAAAASGDGASASPLDRWLKLRIDSTAKEVASGLEAFNPPRASAALLALVDDLSNWWVRRSRRRFWRGGSDADKETAYRVLHTALVDFARLLAPFMPFTAEALYQRLRVPFTNHMPESVHLCEFPEAAEAAGDGALIDECARAREVIRLGRAARAEAGLRVRQPLAAAWVVTEDGAAGELPNFERDVLEEINVKALRFAGSAEGLEGARASEGGVTVVLDTELTEDLVLEGIARDLVRRVQNLRKQADLHVDQRIALWVTGSTQVTGAVREFADYLAAEALAAQLNEGAAPPEAATSECRIAGERVALALVGL
jgi:isoleucyl-tRNA synthetase